MIAGTVRGMQVLNGHERVLAAEPAEVGALLDRLSSHEDGIWPRDRWPSMRFDRPLGVGAVGGHGPIRYDVEDYQPGRSVRFRFTAPRGFLGTHGYEIEERPEGVVLRHMLKMRTEGPALLSWPLVFRPLHDALIEDSLDRAERSLGREPARPARWSLRVRLLRSLFGGRRRR